MIFRWSKRLEMPVVHVDYRLSPKHKFPEGLDDVWQVYYSIITNAKKYGLNTEKIIITGDSAGGNLALAVTIWAI